MKGQPSFFRRNALIMVLMPCSLIAHISLGWAGFSDTIEIQLPAMQAGRTSVQVQLVARPMTEALQQESQPVEVQPMAVNALQRRHHEARVIASNRGSEPPPVVPVKQISGHLARHISEQVDDQQLTRDDAIVKPRRKRRRTSSGLPSVSAPAEMNVHSSADVGARVEPTIRSKQQPVHPPQLLARRIEGTVRLRMTIGLDGHATNVRVERSSGYRSMDNAAVTAVKKWQFNVGSRSGRKSAMDVRTDVNFHIRTR